MIFLRNIRLYFRYKAWVIATIIWPLPLLALNIYQYKPFGTDVDISTALQNYGVSNFAGMIIVGTIAVSYTHLTLPTNREV